MLLLLFTQGRGAWPSLGLPVSATLWPPRHPCSETAKGIGPARGVPPGRATRRPFRLPDADSVVYMSSSGQPSWLAKFAGVEYAKWPPWAKAKFSLCRVAVSGAAATSVGAADRGISVPRGGATSELSGQLGLATSTWSPTVSIRRRLRAAAIALLPAPNGEDAAEAPEEETVVCASCDDGDDTPGPLSSAELDGLCEAACDAGDTLAATPAPPRPPVGSIDFTLENPVNALWLIILTAHAALSRWYTVTTSYCMRPSWDLGYRKCTRFMSSLQPATPFPPPCSTVAPCPATVAAGKHKYALGAAGARGINGYYLRSRVPAELCADFLETWLIRRAPSHSKMLVLDLCASGQSVRAGLSACLQRAGVRHLTAAVRYSGVDLGAEAAPLLPLPPDVEADLSSADLATVVADALAVHGWTPSPDVAVFVWCSPPCESYSRVTLGTLSAPRFGGPQRASREGGYAPVPGPRGDNARAADALSLRLIIHLHHWAATGP